MKPRMLVLSGVALLSLASASHAADFTLPPAEPIPTWSGFHIGIIGGYGWGDFDADWIGTGSQDALNGNSFSIDVKGALIGGQVGADYETAHGMVIGVLADMSWTGIDGKDCADISHCPSPPPWPLSYGTFDVNWLATIRGRLGWATDNMLFYGTAGIAIADTDLQVTNISGVTPGKDSKTLGGIAAGAGVEIKLSQSVSVGAEYLYVNFGEEHYNLLDLGGGCSITTAIVKVIDCSNTAGVDGELALQIVRASLNLRF